MNFWSKPCFEATERHLNNSYRVCSLWSSLKVRISFSRPWKSVKTEWGLWKFVNFVIFRALGKNCQLISRKLHFPRTNSRLIKTPRLLCEITKNALPISSARNGMLRLTELASQESRVELVFTVITFSYHHDTFPKRDEWHKMCSKPVVIHRVDMTGCPHDEMGLTEFDFS